MVRMEYAGGMYFFFSIRRRHTRCLSDWSQTCALPILLSAQGIETGIHYPIPLHAQPVLGGLGYQLGAFPNAERLAAHSLSLPMYPEMPLSHVERVADAITGRSSRTEAAAA